MIFEPRGGTSSRYTEDEPVLYSDGTVIAVTGTDAQEAPAESENIPEPIAEPALTFSNEPAA